MAAGFCTVFLPMTLALAVSGECVNGRNEHPYPVSSTSPQAYRRGYHARTTCTHKTNTGAPNHCRNRQRRRGRSMVRAMRSCTVTRIPPSCTASHPDELVQRAAELGYTALAITDRHSLAGVVRAHVAAKDAVASKHADRRGRSRRTMGRRSCCWRRIAWPPTAGCADLLSRGKLRKPPRASVASAVSDLAEFAAGLLACVPLAICSAALPGNAPAREAPPCVWHQLQARVMTSSPRLCFGHWLSRHSLEAVILQADPLQRGAIPRHLPGSPLATPAGRTASGAERSGAAGKNACDLAKRLRLPLAATNGDAVPQAETAILAQRADRHSPRSRTVAELDHLEIPQRRAAHLRSPEENRARVCSPPARTRGPHRGKSP